MAEVLDRLSTGLIAGFQGHELGSDPGGDVSDERRPYTCRRLGVWAAEGRVCVDVSEA